MVSQGGRWNEQRHLVSCDCQQRRSIDWGSELYEGSRRSSHRQYHLERYPHSHGARKIQRSGARMCQPCGCRSQRASGSRSSHNGGIANGSCVSIGGPVREEKARKRTYKTKKETAKSKNITSTLVVTLLFISVVVPMLQYYGYTSKE